MVCLWVRKRDDGEKKDWGKGEMIRELIKSVPVGIGGLIPMNIEFRNRNSLPGVVRTGGADNGS